MCGIAGLLSTQQHKVQLPTLHSMAKALAHRGPDGEGFYINDKQQIGLAHRRLAIVDLTNKGTQPLHYANRYTIIHNGEVYNYIELRKQLQQLGHSFSTATDTEVIVAAYAQYGNKCVDYFDGMFAFAIWDEVEQLLFIARDRFGEKPLYYYTTNDSFYFASELKALWSIGVPKQINHTMLCQYLGAGFTQLPLEPQLTFYQNILSLPPSHTLTVQYTTKTITLTQLQYWDIDKVTTIKISEQEATAQFTTLLQKSIQHRLRSDVAIGTSLSGGLDSSSIAAVLSQSGYHNYQTFSAIFPNYEKDESGYIQQVATALQLTNKTVAPNATAYAAHFDAIIATQEQPFMSSSVYAQYAVYELAKTNNIKVLLDGQGADEILAGYDKYLHWYLQELFLFDKKRFKQELVTLQQTKQIQFGWRNKMAAWFPAVATQQLEKKVWQQIKYNNFIAPDYVSSYYNRLCVHKPLVKKLNDLLYYNTMQFGLQELLRYADKNSMANGVEVRLPFLQHELVQFIYSLPAMYKIKNGFTKSILRQSVAALLPTNMVWRKDKIGFQEPQEDWLSTSFFTEKISAAKKELVAQGILQKSVHIKPTTTEQNFRIMIAKEYL